MYVRPLLLCDDRQSAHLNGQSEEEADAARGRIVEFRLAAALTLFGADEMIEKRLGLSDYSGSVHRLTHGIYSVNSTQLNNYPLWRLWRPMDDQSHHATVYRAYYERLRDDRKILWSATDRRRPSESNPRTISLEAFHCNTRGYALVDELQYSTLVHSYRILDECHGLEPGVDLYTWDAHPEYQTLLSRDCNPTSATDATPPEVNPAEVKVHFLAEVVGEAEVLFNHLVRSE
jgi:hypothetical protein